MNVSTQASAGRRYVRRLSACRIAVFPACRRFWRLTPRKALAPCDWKPALRLWGFFSSGWCAFLESQSMAGRSKSPRAVASKAIPVAELKREIPVDFEKEILPSSRRVASAATNQTKAKADSILKRRT